MSAPNEVRIIIERPESDPVWDSLNKLSIAHHKLLKAWRDLKEGGEPSPATGVEAHLTAVIEAAREFLLAIYEHPQTYWAAIIEDDLARRAIGLLRAAEAQLHTTDSRGEMLRGHLVDKVRRLLMLVASNIEQAAWRDRFGARFAWL
jgi:hypothetical protein